VRRAAASGARPVLADPCGCRPPGGNRAHGNVGPEWRRSGVDARGGGGRARRGRQGLRHLERERPRGRRYGRSARSPEHAHRRRSRRPPRSAWPSRARAAVRGPGDCARAGHTPAQSGARLPDGALDMCVTRRAAYDRADCRLSVRRYLLTASMISGVFTCQRLLGSAFFPRGELRCLGGRREDHRVGALRRSRAARRALRGRSRRRLSAHRSATGPSLRCDAHASSRARYRERGA
jgi:hypothetical protein